MPRIEKLTRSEIIAKRKEIDGANCFHPECGKPFLSDEDITIDHWMPQSWAIENGWTYEEIWDISNLRLMHKPCNAKKGDLVPNSDGSLPKRAVKASVARAVKRANRPVLCELCMSGRLLLPGEECPECGSGPQPVNSPRALQVRPKECDHDEFRCWLCILDFIPRKSAIQSIIEGFE